MASHWAIHLTQSIRGTIRVLNLSKNKKAESSSSKERLDVVLVSRELAETRTKAQALIMAGEIRVDGQIVTKVGTRVAPDQTIECVPAQRFASRGGEKLDGALNDFNLDVAGTIGLDVGASTGGFTDCLLQRHAEKVFAIDVGTAQILDRLRNHPKVVSMEKTHILSVEPEALNPTPNLAVIDVSFISISRILSKVCELTTSDAKIIAMVKPQFEVGPKFLKKGVVRDPDIQKKAVNDIIACGEKLGLYFHQMTPSRIKGPKGNQEFFVYFSKGK